MLVQRNLLLIQKHRNTKVCTFVPPGILLLNAFFLRVNVLAKSFRCDIDFSYSSPHLHQIHFISLRVRLQSCISRNIIAKNNVWSIFSHWFFVIHEQNKKNTRGTNENEFKLNKVWNYPEILNVCLAGIYFISQTIEL